MMSAGSDSGRPRGPEDFGWLLDDFASATPGVTHALLVSSDGLALAGSGAMPADFADPLAAMTSGMISLGDSIARRVGESGCEQVMLKFASGHFLFMSIGSLAGLAVLVNDSANLGAVAYRMTQMVQSVGHVLTPKMRDDLRRLSAGQVAP
ncbi:roadblock/LC7 domain-containing protein [Actinomadura vinacea]|uniref:Roadblock/LC7 domain-containing protein n=1 Tax=Actinomadura vinacea TaxID=115336 RepID=A0ABN3JJ50_9ACTN